MRELSTSVSYQNSKDFGEMVKAEDLRFETLIKERKLGDRYK